MSDTSSVTTNFFAKGDEAYAATLSSSISAGAATVPVTVSTAGDYVDGDIAALTVSPGTANQATFIGRKSGSSWLDCVWTEGNTGVGQSSGATVIDYDSATHQSALVKGILQFADQSGRLNPTKLWDANTNETLELGSTASAVNQLKVTNAATGNAPVLEPSGGDTNTGLTIQGKGTGTVIITALAPRYANAAKTSNYTATANDHTLRCDATSAGFTVTLPTAASIAGKRYTITKTDSSTNVVTVDGAGSETINGVAAIQLGKQYDSITIESDGSNWNIHAQSFVTNRGYAQITSSFTSTDTGVFDVTGLSITVIAPGHRDLELVCSIPSMKTSAAAGSILMASIRESGTIFAQYTANEPVSAYNVPMNVVARIAAPSAGSHTYKVTAAGNAAGTHTIGAGTASGPGDYGPAFIMAKLV